MNIQNPVNYIPTVASASSTAVEGIQVQEERLDRNVTEAARAENSNASDSGTQDRALVEQSEIVRAVQANARSLEIASENLGTLLDISV
jgi:hypothetical protein